MATSIDIKDSATPAVKAVLESAAPSRINPIVGRAGANRVQQHLFGLNSSRPNKLGGKRTNFWSQAAKGTSFAVLPDGAVVSINQIGFRQRLQGGTISPRNAKFLTIPAIAEAYGKRAREFSNLRFAILNGHPCLIEAEHSAVKFTPGGKVKATLNLGGQVYYWLARKVTQQPDRSVLPTDEELGAAVVAELDAYLKRESVRASGGSRA